jgi:hypothetical protein
MVLQTESYEQLPTLLQPGGLFVLILNIRRVRV